MAETGYSVFVGPPLVSIFVPEFAKMSQYQFLACKEDKL